MKGNTLFLKDAASSMSGNNFACEYSGKVEAKGEELVDVYFVNSATFEGDINVNPREVGYAFSAF
jgi:hypothetical protein